MPDSNLALSFWALMPITVTDSRTPEQLRQHYEVERELADRLRHATKEQRRTL